MATEGAIVRPIFCSHQQNVPLLDGLFEHGHPLVDLVYRTAQVRKGRRLRGRPEASAPEVVELPTSLRLPLRLDRFNGIYQHVVGS